jgi:serine/threonine-protein kinase
MPPSDTDIISVKVCLKCRSAFRTRRDTCPKDGNPLTTGDIEPGTILAGKYRIIDELGRGGMGNVYRAEHIIMGKVVALKVIHPLLSLSPRFLEMFKAEARHAATFKHDNVLTVHDFGESEGRFYLVMELLEGQNLKTLVRRSGSLVPERAFNIVLQICSAVAAAHEKGIVHLDLKSENVFILDTPEGDVVKVLDFGLAQLKEGASSDVGDGLTIGTVGYMAPEQILGGDVDERTDVYAIGAMAYEMLTGKVPFPGETKEEILQSQINGRRLKFPSNPVMKTIPRKARSAILATVDDNPAKRPGSVAALAESLRDALDDIRKAASRYARRHNLEDRRTVRGPTLVKRASSIIRNLVKRQPAGPRPPEGMVYVPTGEFVMGSDSGASDERPGLRVPLGAFFIDIVPVTNLQYARFVQDTDHRPPATWKTISLPPGTGELPVTGVTWQDAADYAQWAGKRLPTEAEWEKAARGTDRRLFPWGNKWDATYANWGGNPRFYGGATIQPVGSFQQDRSPYGCLDMSGNVKEWTASWYKPHGPTSYKSDDFGERFRVARGGSYLSLDRNYLRASCRSHMRPDEAGDIGFRCVKDV